MDPLGNPTSLAARSLQSIAGGGNMPALRSGEEVEVLGGPCREVLRAALLADTGLTPAFLEEDRDRRSLVGDTGIEPVTSSV
jgi:hypothetical protein